MENMNQINNNNVGCEEHSEAIKVLTNAFHDYKSQVDGRIDALKSRNTQTKMEDVMPIQQNHMMEYITKGGSGFAVQGGYSVIPEVDFVSAPEYVSVIRSLATIIKQGSGMEHDLIRIADNAFVRTPTGDVPLVEPTPIKVKLHKLEFGIFLRTAVTSSMPANFEGIVRNSLYKQFAKFEDELFLSDAGVEGKIDGIGNLAAEGFKSLEMTYDENAQTLYNYLFKMIAMMSSEYMDKAVWLMSPAMFTALTSIMDSYGRFMNMYDYQNPTLFGLPVHCHDQFNTTTHKIILANIKEGYTFVEYPNVLALHDNYRNRDGVTNYFTRLIGGAVTNKEPWVSLKIKNLPTNIVFRMKEE